MTEEQAVRATPLRLPEGIFFAPSHTWLSLYPTGAVRLGVDDFISHLLLKPKITLLKAPGEHVLKGEPLMKMMEGNHSLTIRSPLEGDILNRNEALHEHPALLNERLFSDGWSYMMKPKRLHDIKRMLIGTETKSWIGNEFQRLRDLFASMNRNDDLSHVFLQDGGAPIAGLLSTMDDAVWQQLDHEFLQVN